MNEIDVLKEVKISQDEGQVTEELHKFFGELIDLQAEKYQGLQHLPEMKAYTMDVLNRNVNQIKLEYLEVNGERLVKAFFKNSTTAALMNRHYHYHKRHEGHRR